VSPFLLTRTLPEDATEAALRADVLKGLTHTPKTLPPKWFYDAHGSELFEQITGLPVVAALGVSRTGRVAPGVAGGLRSGHVAVLHRVAFQESTGRTSTEMRQS
jgi:hypothetical protein